MEEAPETLAVMMQRFEGAKLSSAEDTPVARRAMLSFLQCCMG